jgi:hypothetical protein
MKPSIPNKERQQFVAILGVFGFVEPWLDNEGAIIE